MHPHPLTLACALALGLAATPLAAQQDLTTLQAEAEAALVAGDPARTATLAQAILDAAPDSYAGLFLMAVAQADLGNDSASAAAAARAYDAAPDRQGRLQSARLAARAHRAQRHYVRAEFWLRRAANNIGNEAEAEAVVREYIATTQENPLTVRFNGAITPSDNVNGGSSEGILEFEGIPLTFLLPENQRALSGVGFSGSAQASYRLQQNDVARTSLSGALAAETYVLSKEARNLLDSSPNAEIRALDGSDFGTTLLQAGIVHQRTDLSTLGPTGFGLNFGTYWSGDERIVDFVDYSLSQVIVVDAQSSYLLRADIRDQSVRTTALVPTVSYDYSATYRTRFDNRDRLDFGVSRRRNEAGPESSYTEYTGRLGYDFAQPIFGTKVGAAAELRYRNYPVYTTTLNGRRDYTARIEATTIFENVTYFGFSPSLSMAASRTFSNAEEEISSGVEIRLGIESNF